jgi:hypothetical protein
MPICRRTSSNARFLNVTGGECDDTPVQFDGLTAAIPRNVLVMTFSQDVIWEVDISKSVAEFKVPVPPFSATTIVMF